MVLTGSTTSTKTKKLTGHGTSTYYVLFIHKFLVFLTYEQYVFQFRVILDEIKISSSLTMLLSFQLICLILS